MVQHTRGMAEPTTLPTDTGVEVSTALPAAAEVVWEHATSFRGINAELWPWLRMTHPADRSRLTAAQVRPGQRLFRSWLLAFGVLPVDVDDITIAELGPGRRFLERSRMLSASVWEHERVVTERGPDACEVTDRVRFTPRWPLLRPLLGTLVPRIFAHRHRRLRQIFTAGDPGATHYPAP